MMNGTGISNVWTIFEDLKRAHIIVTAGSWSAMNLDGQELKFQGWSGLQEKCDEDPTLYERLKSVWQQVQKNVADLHV